MSLEPVADVDRVLPHPPRRLWEALTDPAARAAWIPGFVAHEPEPDALAPGTSWVETRTRFGHHETESVTVVSADAEGGRLVMEADGSAGSARSGRYRSSWSLQPHEAGSRVSVTLEAGDLSRKVSVLVRFLAGPWGRQMEEDLDALEAWLGSG